MTYSHPSLPETWLVLFRSIARGQAPEAAVLLGVDLLARGGSLLPDFLTPGQTVDKQNYTPPPNPQGFPAPSTQAPQHAGCHHLPQITLPAPPASWVGSFLMD